MNQIFGICFVVIIVVLVGVFALRMGSSNNASTGAGGVKQQYQLPGYGGQKSAPATSLNQEAAISADSPKALQQDLYQLADDGGASDLNALKQQAAGL